jgi:hypothetical protein
MSFEGEGHGANLNIASHLHHRENEYADNAELSWPNQAHLPQPCPSASERPMLDISS